MKRAIGQEIPMSLRSSTKICGITQRKAPLRSRKRPAVTSPLVKPAQIAVESNARLSAHDLPFLKLNCDDARCKLCSRCLFSLLWINFSITLYKQEAREIRRNLPRDDLGIKNTRKLFQVGGNEPDARVLLYILRRADLAFGGKWRMML